MAAIRSALAMLGRRSCDSSGYSAATSFGRRGLEISQIFRPAVPGTPALPSLRPAGLNLESWQRFSTVGREPTNKAEGVMRTWVQRCRNRVNNLDVYDRAKLTYAYAIVVLGGATLYVMKG
ncbi:unnamed protein product [Urochloa decumbens]|uniref:Uncharacterized protein n=1 Tax=Urochloa decumbens TaxID=240449 RepID=A0ABC8ZAI3_9POAL